MANVLPRCQNHWLNVIRPPAVAVNQSGLIFGSYLWPEKGVGGTFSGRRARSVITINSKSILDLVEWKRNKLKSMCRTVQHALHQIQDLLR